MRRALLPAVLLWLGVSCAPAAVGQPAAPSSSGQGQSASRTLVAAVSVEPKTLAGRIIAQGSASLHMRRIFNADLALLDDQSSPSAYLAASLPQLNSDDWKLLPDGGMETTYRLRPNLVWHDGTPLTAGDFVFSWRVYSAPDLGQAGLLPNRLMASVEALDDLTLLIHWSQPYADAGALQSLGASSPSGLPALPRHILAAALDAGPEALLNHPFWTSAYVGLGPYRLDRWEPGAFLEASAFDRHVLGMPKISQIKLIVSPDPNATLASMLAGELHVANLALAQAMTLKRQWADGRGSIVYYYNQWLGAHFQHRPDYASPLAVRDVRVRRALAYAVDRQGIDDTLYDGQLPIADSIFIPTSEVGRAADTAVTRYTYDPARSAQIMREAGFTRAPGDAYMSPAGERFSAEIRVETAQEAMMTAMASGWRQAGFEFREVVQPGVQDLRAKSTYPGLFMSATSSGEGGTNSMGSANVPGPENNWRGNAWDGYANPELDRLIAAFGAALAPSDRARAAADIAKLYSDEVPAVSLYFLVAPWVFTSDVAGPNLRPATSNPTWNVHQWELRASR